MKSQEKLFSIAVIDYLKAVIDYLKSRWCGCNRLPKRCNRLHQLNFWIAGFQRTHVIDYHNEVIDYHCFKNRFSETSWFQMVSFGPWKGAKRSPCFIHILMSLYIPLFHIRKDTTFILSIIKSSISFCKLKTSKLSCLELWYYFHILKKFLSTKLYSYKVILIWYSHMLYHSSSLLNSSLCWVLVWKGSGVLSCCIEIVREPWGEACL